MLELTAAGLVVRPASPMGYCNHFGLRRIAESEVRAERLAAALKARRGTLAVSWLNLGEYATVTSRETRLQVERLKSAHEVNTSSEEGGRCGRAAYTRLRRCQTTSAQIMFGDAADGWCSSSRRGSDGARE